MNELDAEDLTLQRKLEDDETQEAIRKAAARQAKGKTRLSVIEAIRSMLRQQLEAADRKAVTAASDTAANDREVAAAEQAARDLGGIWHPRSLRSSTMLRSLDRHPGTPEVMPRSSSPRTFPDVFSWPPAVY